MSHFLITILVIDFISAQTFGRSLSPFCDQSVAQLEIDSTVLILNRIYFFTDWMVTVVDMTEDKIVYISNITQLINFKTNLTYFRPPVHVAHTQSSQGEQFTLILITKTTIWNISLETHTLLDSRPLMTTYELPLDIVNINHSHAYILKKSYSLEETHLCLNFVSLVGKEEEGNCGYSLRYRVESGKKEVIASTLQVSLPLMQLNDKNISSGLFIYETKKIVLFANIYSLGIEFDRWSSFLVKKYFNQSKCNTNSMADNLSLNITSGSDSNGLSRQNVYSWITLVMVIGFIILCLLALSIAVYLNLFQTEEDSDDLMLYRRRYIQNPDSESDKQSDKKTIPATKKNNSDLMSGTFEPKPDTDYSKPIPINSPQKTTTSSEMLMKNRPTALKID